jgi:flagellar biogenesis protein FliO
MAAPIAPVVDMGGSLLRLFGALLFVIALFLGGAWLYRNMDRFSGAHRRSAKLAVLEARSLGHKHALYVVGYERQRLLVSASPSGVSLLTLLPDGEESSAVTSREPTPAGFAAAFERMLAGKGQRAS